MVSLHERITAARDTLVAAGLRQDDAALDARVLARHVLGWDQAQLVVRGRDPAPAGFADRYDAVIARRARREPVAYIVGHREFWGLEFALTPATLVPRPETEFIVDEALQALPPGRAATVLDIGTGSGCLSVAIAVERPEARVIATDISHDALLVARLNARTHGVGDRVRFVCCDLATGLGLQADVIVSNPPYVPKRSAPALSPDVGLYEPHQALFGGMDGLELLSRLFRELPEQLAPGGTFVVEFGFGQEWDAREVAEREGWSVVRTIEDLQGIARTLVLRR